MAYRNSLSSEQLAALERGEDVASQHIDLSELTEEEAERLPPELYATWCKKYAPDDEQETA